MAAEAVPDRVRTLLHFGRLRAPSGQLGSPTQTQVKQPRINANRRKPSNIHHFEALGYKVTLEPVA